MSRKIVFITTVVLFLGGLSMAAAVPVNPDDFTGTSWVVCGKNAFSTGMSAQGFAFLDFDSDGSTFSVTDTADATIYGNYGFDSNGKLFINVGTDDIQEFLDEYLDIYSDYVTATVTSAKSTCKVTYSGNTVNLKMTISAKVRIDIQIEDDEGKMHEYHRSLSFKLNMTGDHPVAGGESAWASKWDITSTASLSAKKIKISMPMPVELTLGDGGSGLGYNEYKLVDTDRVLFSSDVRDNFCRNKGNILFGSEDDWDEMSSIIDEIVSSNSSDYYDYIEISSASVTATVKTGKTNTVTLNGTFKFVALVYDEDKDRDVVVNKGKLKITGTGVPMP